MTNSRSEWPIFRRLPSIRSYCAGEILRSAVGLSTTKTAFAVPGLAFCIPWVHLRSKPHAPHAGATGRDLVCWVKNVNIYP